MTDSRQGKATPLATLVASSLMLAACSQTASTTRATEDEVGSQVNISSLSAVVSQNPSDANGYNVRGTAYGKAGKYKEALGDFETAIRLNPNFYQAYSNRALVQRQLGRDDLAVADYNTAIQISATYDVAYVGRGNIYR